MRMPSQVNKRRLIAMTTMLPHWALRWNMSWWLVLSLTPTDARSARKDWKAISLRYVTLSIHSLNIGCLPSSTGWGTTSWPQGRAGWERYQVTMDLDETDVLCQAQSRLENKIFSCGLKIKKLLASVPTTTTGSTPTCTVRFTVAKLPPQDNVTKRVLISDVG